jgi:protein-S-isoprenylcysteine O-methyltransferase Ste14
MLLVLCATGVIVTPWPLFLVSLIVFIIGTEIRVRTEEKLLASRFGEEFQEYKRTVPGYIPFL